jgi:hypothetical protein
MIPSRGGASEPSDMRLPGKAGGTVAVRRTLACTICRVTADPTQVPRPRQLRDASTVMRFRPAHQSLINRRHDDRASCPARHSLEPMLEIKPRIHLPATWNGGHESASNLTFTRWIASDGRSYTLGCARANWNTASAASGLDCLPAKDAFAQLQPERAITPERRLKGIERTRSRGRARITCLGHRRGGER